MSAALLLGELAAKGIRARLADDGTLRFKPKALLTPDFADRIRAHKDALTARLQVERIARLDRERREADRRIGRGYDVDCSHPDHAEFLERTGQRCACQLRRERNT